ncbi:uncharacterized protein KQ657_000813 [Scheffersomyces spartinae]|uniref:Zn(2)-C6 fungal-type domain-containing protein n=1 Tax=Scheffersomyces spartinae TaxID=45513 RepID=A0A9P8AI59_9ASCO|nr:uncharacterized protein KQ657_000813 [Scheffersomyces spartinae]KAG7193395.1 hypothetical protein KQ657_000813 [Scheffersomyces spartinae]
MGIQLRTVKHNSAKEDFPNVHYTPTQSPFHATTPPSQKEKVPASSAIVLPPIHFLPTIHKSGSSLLPPLHIASPISPPSSYAKLTEYNLTSMGKNPDAVSLPSLTSSASIASSSGSISPIGSPHVKTINILNQAANIVASKESKSFSIKNSPKRRQRLGPSCDSCRVRKVKCNADIVIVLKDMAGTAETSALYNDVDFTPLLKQEVTSIPLDTEYLLLASHNKLIKFKPCTNCTARTIDCCFSKGFTKEDMLHKKPSETVSSFRPPASDFTSAKSSSLLVSKKRKISAVDSDTDTTLKQSPSASMTTYSSPVASESQEDNTTAPRSSATTMSPLPIPVLIPIPALDGSRRSSCAGCRKRKVKCVYNEETNMCHGCFKKGHECLFT